MSVQWKEWDAPVKKPIIYLAGPDVFLENAGAVLAEKKLQLELLGFDVLTPLDLISDDPYEIAVNNQMMIERCDIVLANVEPFRGTEPDSGTVYEIGYAVASKKIVYTYNNPQKNYKERLNDFDRENGQSEFTPEPFGLNQNLMISASCVEFDTFEDVLRYLLHWNY